MKSSRQSGRRKLKGDSEQMSVQAAAESERSTAWLVARMDRLPVLGTHIVWVVLLTANLTIDYYDNALFAYVLPQIMADTGMDLAQVGVISSAFFVGMIFGAIIGGRLADRYGRRTVMVFATAVYSIGAIVTAMGSDFTTMFLARLFTGIGVQAATSVLLVYIAEMFPGKIRGRVVAIVTAAFAVVAPLVGYLAMVTIPNGGPGTWRMLFSWGGFGLVLIPFVLMLMPESVRWQASRGKIDQAFALLEKLEARAVASGKQLVEAKPMAESKVRELSLREIFRSPRIIRTIVVISLAYFGTTLGLYMVSNYQIYVLIDALGFDETKSYSWATLWGVIAIAAPFLALLVMDRFERRTLIFITSVLSAVPLIFFGISTSDWVIFVAGAFWGVFASVVVSAFYAYIPESMPTEARGLGSGIMISVGRSGGVVAGVLGAALYSGGGRATLMIVSAIAYVLFTVVLLFLGPRTTGRSLESVAAEEIGLKTEVNQVVVPE